MMCERCGQREAVVNYIDIEDGVKHTQWLCESCAGDIGLDLPGQDADDLPAASSSELGIFLGDVVGAEADASAEATAPVHLVCPACGYSFKQLQESGLLGCPECYPVFREYLLPILRRYHRATTHLGKAPRARGPRAERRLEIARLRNALETAVAAEDYEEAARLRDLIRERESTREES